MTKYKTPGIYSEEILFCPEIVSVSDIAVFLGYTEKHENGLNKNLQNNPTTINSLQDFEYLFGTAQNEDRLEIIDNSTNFLESISVQFNGSSSLHNLYYSVKSFFDQGGISCKILSVGVFKKIGDQLLLSDFIKGLGSLKRETANLLISVPESQNFKENDFYVLQEKILEFCAKNTCFAILDIPKTNKENFNGEIIKY